MPYRYTRILILRNHVLHILIRHLANMYKTVPSFLPTARAFQRTVEGDQDPTMAVRPALPRAHGDCHLR